MDAAAEKPPFHSLLYSQVDPTGCRSLFCMARQDSGEYELHVEHGGPGDDRVEFTRLVPESSARRLRDDVAACGVYSWDPAYDEGASEQCLRWNLSIVFQQDVFTLQSHGSGMPPAGFEAFKEALYTQDFPRPSKPREPAPSRPAANAFGGFDMAGLFEGVPGGPDPALLSQMQQAFADMMSDPDAFRRQMRDEFRSLPLAQQNQLIDMLASTGMASREWWERFLRG